MKLLLLLAKGGFGKIFLTAGTMLVSVAVYATTFGWPYSVGLVLLILVHELGHFIAARQRGLEVGAPVFVPFVGAWISLKSERLQAETEAYIAMAGPMLGSVATFLVFLYGLSEQSVICMALAQAGFMLNLFNLIPLAPLDGGRLVGVLSPKLWLLGIPIVVCVFLWRPSPLLAVIAIAAAPSLVAMFKGSVPHDTLATTSEKARYGALYLGLALILALLAHDAHQWVHARGIA